MDILKVVKYIPATHIMLPPLLPAAEPSGHRTVRVVVVGVIVGVVGGDYCEVMTLKLTFSQGQLFFA